MRLQDADYTRIVLVTLRQTTQVSEAAALPEDLKRAHRTLCLGHQPQAGRLGHHLSRAGPVYRGRAGATQFVAAGLAQGTFVVPWYLQACVCDHALNGEAFRAADMSLCPSGVVLVDVTTSFQMPTLEAHRCPGRRLKADCLASPNLSVPCDQRIQSFIGKQLHSVREPLLRRRVFHQHPSKPGHDFASLILQCRPLHGQLNHVGMEGGVPCPRLEFDKNDMAAQAVRSVYSRYQAAPFRPKRRFGVGQGGAAQCVW
jgi:hypothetical protein